MADKADRLKARVPRGFVDRAADDIRATEKMMETIRGVYERYGFDPVETPMFEYTDALGKFLPDQDRPNEGVFSLQDDDEQWMSLRYDLTAPLARYVAENYETLPKPYRSYRAGWVFRNEKPGPGRFRQFMQFDADTVGTPGVAADAEMAMMMADVMEALGLYEEQPDGSKKPLYVVRVNNRKVLEGLRESLSVSATISEHQWLTVLRAIDKLDRLGPMGVFQLLKDGRVDESGDRTPGAKLNNAQADNVMRFLGYTRLVLGPTEFEYRLDHLQRPAFTSNIEALDWVRERVNLGPTGHAGIDELKQIGEMVDVAGYGPDRIRIDPSVVRGLEYYTGPVYEAELLFEVPNEKGEIVRFGSVGGGGRYDGLVKRFTGQDVPATGFSIGVSRLMTALKNLGKLGASDVVGPVVVLVMDKDTESLGRYQKMVTDLRNEGIRAEMYLGGSGMKAQMKYADRRGAPCVIIQGSNEREAGTVEIKDLIEGKRLSAEIEDNATWRESRPAQVTVKETDLVAEVKKIIAAQKAERARGR